MDNLHLPPNGSDKAPAYCELVADIKDDAEKFLHLIEMQHAPGQEDFSFSITLPTQDHHALQLPPSLENIIGDIQNISDIVIRCGIDYTALKCSQSVTFASKNLNGTSSFISCAPTSSGTVHVDFLNSSDEHPMPGLDFPNRELNRMFASIYLPNKTGDYSAFDTLDLTDLEIVSNLAQALTRHIPYSSDVSHRKLMTNDSDTSCDVEIVRIGDKPSSINIIRRLTDSKCVVYNILFEPPTVDEDAAGDIIIDNGVSIALLENDTPIPIDLSYDELAAVHDYLQQLLRAPSLVPHDVLIVTTKPEELPDNKGYTRL